MEPNIHWSPHQTTDGGQYVIADNAKSSLTLYSVDAFDGQKVNSLVLAQANRLANFAAFAWSPVQEDLVALGLTSGNSVLVRLGDRKTPSEIAATFKVKQQRKCTTIALNSLGLLAVGLEKNRSDAGLSIHDINSDLTNEAKEPIRRFCAAETVPSVGFFSRTPQELVATTQRAIRIYDVRDDYMAGNSSTVQATTKCVHNISIDPLDENYFASSSGHGDPSYAIWDRRWMSQQTFSGSSNGAVLKCTLPSITGSPSTIRSLRWSGCTRGRLALSSGAGDVRVVDIRQARATNAVTTRTHLSNNSYGGSQWHDNHYVSRTRTLHDPLLDGVSSGQGGLVSFDWLPALVEGQTQRMIVLNSAHDVATVEVPSICLQAYISGRNDMLIGASSLAIGNMAASIGDDVDPLDDSHARSLARLLADSSIPRKRCREGYLFDCDKNIKIVAADERLERLWRLLRRFQSQARDDGMVGGSLDLSYIGVAAIWAEDIFLDGRRYTEGTSSTVAEAITSLISSRSIPQFEGARTSFPEHRQLCLALCGWKFTIETLEEECQELIGDGQYYLAIVQAVLHGYKHIALNLLRSLIRSKTIPNIGLGALLASTEINEEQHEMCLWMEADADDPALKALLTYLTTGDWRTVMKTTYLDSDYRIALGLKYLNDTELSGFLQSETARAVRNGDLEGILLTGLTELTMDLLHIYVTKSGDVQTAVLASAYANPRYVDDMRWDAWRETYFEQMQTWQAFSERARFTVQHNALSTDRVGRSYKKAPVQEMKMLCKHCRVPLGGTTPWQRSNQTIKGSSGASSIPLSGRDRTICLQCGRHLPRCSICGLWLGTLESSTPRPMLDSGSEPEPAEGAELKLSGFLTFCVKCEHAYHAEHANEWFEKHNLCAVPGCQCRCSVL